MNTANEIEKHIVREQIIKTIRQFFYGQNFHEIIVPLLNTALPLEPNLKPFVTIHEYENKKQIFYLPHSPERGIKKMLGAGMDNCFAISQSFRNYERVGSLHLHEFTMLEWYRKGAMYGDIMRDVERLLETIDNSLGKKTNKHALPRVSLNMLFKEKVGEKLETLIFDEKMIEKIARGKGYKTIGATWEELYNQLFVNEIEPLFSKEPFFLVDFPACISPLCKKQDANLHFAERFELYVGGMEIGNGNTENTNVKEIRSVFENEHAKTGLPIDEEFLDSLYKMKKDSYAGVGIGINRLTMLYTDRDIFV